MIDSLNLGKYIYSSLKEVTNNVYPLVADNNVKFPFLVYRRANLVSQSNKDGYVEDTVVMEIVAVSDTYKNSIDLISKVRQQLEHQEKEFDDLVINDAYITMATEEYSNNAFVQKIQITFNVNKN